MNVSFNGYRDWAKDIFKNLWSNEPKSWKFTSIDEADVILYYGWSEMIPKEIYTKKLCFILHPSPLPKYRGGSPIQNQIIAGEKTSAVTICRVVSKIDAGPIYSQTPFSLEGSLDNIFKKIVDIGTRDTIRLLDDLEAGTAKFTPQQEIQATTFKRRKPSESEITNFESADQVYNHIRMLDDPYPNAYIKCKDGKKVYITGAHL